MVSDIYVYIQYQIIYTIYNTCIYVYIYRYIMCVFVYLFQFVVELLQ